MREKQAQRMMQRDKEVEVLRQTIEFVNLEREQEAKAFDERAKDLETLLENTKKISKLCLRIPKRPRNASSRKRTESLTAMKKSRMTIAQRVCP